ncbi:MAG: chemotaxis protein CheW [bacterium]|nr:chemotaxis protein CheW [bacterium]
MESKSDALFTQAGGKLLTFMLGGQEYGIQILEAREVIGMMEPEPVPNTPEFMLGIINLRGKIIPILSLRAKFHLPPGEVTPETCVLVADLHGRQTGCKIDSLVGVVTIEPHEYEEHLDMGANINTDFILGIAKLKERTIIVLDMEEIVDHEEVHAIAPAG